MRTSNIQYAISALNSIIGTLSFRL